MDGARITYAPCPDATPEGEVRVLAAVYRYVLLQSSVSKKAAHPGGLDDAEDSENARTANDNCTS
jgi:hypothetical protein